MKFTELKPEFRPVAGSALAKQYALERAPGAPQYMGVNFTCPCGKHEVWIPFRRSEPETDKYGSSWIAHNETPELLTLEPSILDRGCGAHYYIRNGEIVTC